MPLRLITLPSIPSSFSSCLDHGAVNNESEEDASSDGGTINAVFLGSHHLGDRGVERIADGLEDSCRLYFRIHLDNNQITTKGAQLISSSLKHCPTLLELSLADNPLSNEGARHLASSLVCNDTLEMLNVSNCGIGALGVDALSYVLEHNNASLRWLDLSSNPMGDAGSQSMLSSRYYIEEGDTRGQEEDTFEDYELPQGEPKAFIFSKSYTAAQGAASYQREATQFVGVPVIHTERETGTEASTNCAFPDG
ncbi:hypothetical protein THAOC_04218 [Thalassiosira oceanica]|uniref:Uncharacterized protein n=1 Tax=Thalassiosira oceanica TaxID=159749 RepID=K0TAJ4_THAOC|nr:hypothetical protein THAOC_04218 [Thalassiosira oceanica]|eukprot:EJK74124.1 hypothetical protein THAOC_04218 [Thalassiosira oceanica]